MWRRSCRSSSPLTLVMSRPLKMMRPEVASIRRSTARPVVVLPEPDSPTRPSVSPALTSKETLSSALIIRGLLQNPDRPAW